MLLNITFYTAHDTPTCTIVYINLKFNKIHKINKKYNHDKFSDF